MKAFFGNYKVALSFLLLSFVLAVCIGQYRKDYYIAKQNSSVAETVQSSDSNASVTDSEADSTDDSFIDKAVEKLVETDAFERIEEDEDKSIGKGGIIVILLILYAISKKKKK